jgi:hypothetical protein
MIQSNSSGLRFEILRDVYHGLGSDNLEQWLLRTVRFLQKHELSKGFAFMLQGGENDHGYHYT